MQIALLVFAGEFRWKVSAACPRLFEIHAYPGIDLVSPLLFPTLIRSRYVNGSPRLLGSVEGLNLIRTEGIALKIRLVALIRVHRERPID